MDCCISNLKIGAFLTSLLGTGSLPTGAIMSGSTRSIQPLVASSAITVLASVIGLVVGEVCRQLGIAKNTTAQVGIALLSSGVAYIGLAIAGIATGLMPGGVLGIAMLTLSVVLPILMFFSRADVWNMCLN